MFTSSEVSILEVKSVHLRGACDRDKEGAADIVSVQCKADS